MTTFRHLFLDLEQTIITPVADGWRTAELINLDKINAMIRMFQPTGIHVFSFAIWNQSELSGFNEHVRDKIENAINCELSQVLTVDDDIIPICCEVKKILASTVDFCELTAFWGKGEAFRLVMRHRFRNIWKDMGHEIETVLVDDAVWNESWEWPDLHMKGQLINIDNFDINNFDGPF